MKSPQPEGNTPVTDSQASPSNSGNGLKALTIHDQELLHLPDVHATGTRPPRPSAIRRNSLTLQHFVDSKTSSPDSRTQTNTNNTSKSVTSSKNMPDIYRSDLMADSLTEDLPGLLNLSSKLVGDRSWQSNGQAQLHKRGPQFQPHKIRPYQKSQSQKEFSVAEKETGLPDILPSGSQKVVEIQRSSSVLTVLPPIAKNLAKSNSQPDISKCVSPAPRNSCILALTKRIRVRQMWRRAFNKLRSVPQTEEGEAANKEVWTLSCGDVLRPVYSRWNQRRHALAEPERMCMPQALREQIQQDVKSRRRTMKRKVSNFLNVKIGLNLEEDLSA